MKVEVNYKVLRVLIVVLIVTLVSIFTIKILGKGQIIHKFGFRKDIIVSEDQEFNYNILNIFGDIYIQGKIVGNIASINSDIYVDGEVRGNIISIFGKIHKGKKAKTYGRELKVSKEKKDYIIKNKILDINQVLYIVFGIFSCFSLYFIDVKHRIREANKFPKKIYEMFKFGYIIEVSGGMLLIILILGLLGIQFSPAIGMIPLISMGMFIMYLIGCISLMIYIGMKVNTNISIYIPYPIYMSLFIVVYSFIRNIPYVGEITGFLIIIPVSLGSVYLEYFHNCLKHLECNVNEKKI